MSHLYRLQIGEQVLEQTLTDDQYKRLMNALHGMFGGGKRSAPETLRKEFLKTQASGARNLVLKHERQIAEDGLEDWQPELAALR